MGGIKLRKAKARLLKRREDWRNRKPSTSGSAKTFHQPGSLKK